jgi:hypothetical protein
MRNAFSGEACGAEKQALFLTICRLIAREAAAAFVCVSPRLFDEMIKAGRMPRPRFPKSGALGM